MEETGDLIVRKKKKELSASLRRKKHLNRSGCCRCLATMNNQTETFQEACITLFNLIDLEKEDFNRKLYFHGDNSDIKDRFLSILKKLIELSDK